MTQEEKQILLKDLCSRLPYGVKIQLRNTYNYHHENICKQGDFTIDEIKSIDKKGETIKIYHNNPLDWEWYIDDIEIEDVKPYLRPMSSMTEEEKNECFGRTMTIDIVKTSQQVIDWLLKNHFDFRGLLEKDLALPAPEGMYEKIK